MKTLPTNKIDLASRWRPQPAVGGPSQPRRVAKFLFKIQCPSQPLAAPASCIRMLHSSCSKSSAPPFGICLGAPHGIASVGCCPPNFLPISSQPLPNVLPLLKYFVLLAVALLCWNDSSVRSRPIQIHILGVLICSSSVIVAGRWQALGNAAHLWLVVGIP